MESEARDRIGTFPTFHYRVTLEHSYLDPAELPPLGRRAEAERLHIRMSQSKSETVEQHYTVAEVAALLRVHEMTVRNWYSKKGLRIQRVGRLGIRIASSDLKLFLEAFNQSTPTFGRAPGDSGSTVATRRSGSRKEQ